MTFTVGEAFILVDIVPLIIAFIIIFIYTLRKEKNDNKRSDIDSGDLLR